MKCTPAYDDDGDDSRSFMTLGEERTLRSIAKAAHLYLEAENVCEARPSIHSPRWAAKNAARGVLMALLDAIEQTSSPSGGSDE
jgi:hypothetical protein